MYNNSYQSPHHHQTWHEYAHVYRARNTYYGLYPDNVCLMVARTPNSEVVSYPNKYFGVSLILFTL